jgi:flavorubredoxin
MTGHNKRIARAIASVFDVKAESFKKANDELVDLLFIGGGIYAGGLDSKFVEYLKNINKEQKKIVLFSSAASPKEPSVLMRKVLEDSGHTVEEKAFFIRGRFLFLSISHPNKKDLQLAKDFASSFLS